ncbi:shikimate dehydrogenase [bacterium]|nr:shikimate dehydrogenase [bacterium]MBU1983994.1 shikimate dehydrogenase [bacterium]
MNSEKTLRLGLIGRDISYSLSPRIHQWGLVTLGLYGEYRLYDIKADEIPSLLRSSEWDGLNVTVPHKTLVAGLCNILTEEARLSQSVNVLFRREGKIWGNTTDGKGFLCALNRLVEHPISVRRVLIIGSGGAARAVLLSLGRHSAIEHVVVASRNPEQTERNLALMKANCTVVSLEQAASELIEYDLVVQATPVGSAQVQGLPLPQPFRFAPIAHVMDLIYSPRKTEFLRLAESNGCRVQNGLLMLIGQAAASFKLWTNIPFPLERAMKELLPELEVA